jgi:hypothetical protein
MKRHQQLRGSTISIAEQSQRRFKYRKLLAGDLFIPALFDFGFTKLAGIIREREQEVLLQSVGNVRGGRRRKQRGKQ